MQAYLDDQSKVGPLKANICCSFIAISTWKQVYQKQRKLCQHLTCASRKMIFLPQLYSFYPYPLILNKTKHNPHSSFPSKGFTKVTPHSIFISFILLSPLQRYRGHSPWEKSDTKPATFLFWIRHGFLK
jgi:membrane-bound acyltransferase YfiQ involved in biofilm formation